MWAFRILSGPQAGQIYPLAPGKSTIGRGSGCEVKIDSTSVSKEHAVVLVMEDKIILTDLNSRNGTYVNGVRIQNQRLQYGDKMSLHDILIDVIQVPNSMYSNRPMVPTGGVYPAPPPAWAGGAAVRLENQISAHAQVQYSTQPQANHAGPHLGEQPVGAPGLKLSGNSVNEVLQNARIYIDNVAMPGVYMLAQKMPYKYAIAALLGLYIVAVSALSIVPVVSTTRDNIRLESMRRAKTIARQMAASNRQALMEHNELQISLRTAEIEEGVTSAILLSAKDGTIIAPANKRGEFVNKPFVNKARRHEEEYAEVIDDSNIGVSVPIKVFSSESNSQSVVAFAIILYDMGSLAMNSVAAFTLFMQGLLISLVLGFIFYFFLTRVIENPIDALNAQLDDALREGRDDLKSPYQYPAIERLGSNINSALSRIGQDAGPAAVLHVNRDMEAVNVVRIAAGAAVAVNAIDERVIATNAGFDHLVGGGSGNLSGRPLTDINDPAVKANLQNLVERMRTNPSEIASNSIPFSGRQYMVNGQAVMGSSEPVYYLIIFAEAGEG